MNIVANDLKTKGVGAIDTALQHAQEAVVTVRGRAKYVTMSVDRYNQFREYELESSLREVREDIKNGDFTETSAAEHIATL
ncbi:MAG: prevent-host-death protein [Endozoicomonadaceae bacterium]|nr:prevent-host-death protein [Endozoicomonadaceae bacterium]